MRIIGGTQGGRKIKPPAQMPYTRPTTDVAKEGLFNILQNNLDFTVLNTLDLFGGTGCISYELASRGALSCTIVEKDPKMFNFIKETSIQLGLQQITPVRSDVFDYMKHCNNKYDLIFAGPPYALTQIDELPRLVFQLELLSPGGWFILEHTPRNQYQNTPYFRSERHYGTTLFSFFHQPVNV